MLFLLTGDVQTGKTRWLMRTLPELGERGIAVSGVLNPGLWRHRCPQEIEQEGGIEAVGEYEKLGIDALLLPQRERFPFAVPASRSADAPDGFASQSRAAKLAWDISDEALATINAYFDALAKDAPDAGEPGLLVIDELGRLELLRNGGLTSALRMVDAGPSAAFPHMLAIVRSDLLDIAHARFGQVWKGGIADIFPNDDAARMILEAYSL